MNQSKINDPRFWRCWANSGAVKYFKMELKVYAGDSISKAIKEAINLAESCDVTLYEVAMVQMVKLFSNKKVSPYLVSFNFNGVNISVCQDSDPDLICRDWHRNISGYITCKVGPYPKATLSSKELAKDSKIKKEKDALWEKENAEYQVIQNKKEAVFFSEINTCPAMDRNEEKWQQGIKAQNGDGYGLAVFTYAEYWARLMQKKIGEGYKLSAIANECSNKADIPVGITGFMYGCAVSILANCWKHGEELRLWHNIDIQLSDEGEKANVNSGVINPALLRIS